MARDPRITIQWGAHRTWRYHFGFVVGWVLALTPWYPHGWVRRQLRAGTEVIVGSQRIRLDAPREEWERAVDQAVADAGGGERVRARP